MLAGVEVLKVRKVKLQHCVLASKSVAMYSAVPLLHGTDSTFSMFPIGSQA